MKATINTSLVSKLSPRSKPYEVRDDKLTGFLVRVNISGKLLYMCEYARGKRVTIGKVGVLTPAQARDMALSILSDASKGIDPRPNKKKQGSATLKEFMDNHYIPWFNTHRKSGQKTLGHLHICFVKPFGNTALSDFTPAQMDAWRTQRLKQGVKTESVNREIAIFKAALSRAVLWGIIETNPLEKLKLLKSDRSVKVRFLSSAEESRLREAALTREARMQASRVQGNKWREERDRDLLPDISQHTFTDHLRPMILLSINTGIRRGELFSLTWGDINFEQAMLTIDGSFAKSGKTRHIPLNTEVLSTLKAWRNQTTSTGLVFPGKYGKRFDTIKTGWKAIIEAAKIEGFRWHDLRHHFASRLVMAGVDLNTVRELLGHSEMGMTLRYAHLAPEHKASAVEKLVQTKIIK